jgi:hypothetical protein
MIMCHLEKLRVCGDKTKQGVMRNLTSIRIIMFSLTIVLAYLSISKRSPKRIHLSIEGIHLSKTGRVAVQISGIDLIQIRE